MNFARIAPLAGTAILIAGAAFAQMNPMVGGAEMSPEKNAVENASAAPNLSTLVAAVKAAGLAETLSGAGPFTIFAPTDDAFAKLPAGTVDTLLKPENKEMLATILKCHVVGADVSSEALAKMIKDDGGKAEVDTLGGCKLEAAMDGENITLTDENGTVATVETADVKQSNGVVHVIDAVMTPKK